MDVDVQQEQIRIKRSKDMSIDRTIYTGILEYGLKKPSVIQQLVVAPIISGRDVIVKSSDTGDTSKTIIIAISVGHIVDKRSFDLQALVLSPTRKFAARTKEVISEICRYKEVDVHACIGGKTVEQGIRILQHEHYYFQIVSGTPGRVLNMIKNGALNPKHIKLLILDDFDEMQGCKDEIDDIYRCLTHDKLQVVLISSTLPNAILEMTRKFMKNPVQILVPDEIVDNEHYFVNVESDETKLYNLLDVYDRVVSGLDVMIYCNTNEKVDWLAAKWAKWGKKFFVVSMHGGTSRYEVDAKMRLINSNPMRRVLITTDGVLAKRSVPQVL